MERKVIVIVGPTCSGKSNLAIDLALKLNTEILSADSRQFYKFLNIGTAKLTTDDLSKVKHHFIDSHNPDELFNASQFENASIEIIKKLHKQNKIPVVVGGSGLYVKALVDGIFNNVDSDEEIRSEIMGKREKFGNEFIYNELKKVDPESAKEMLPQNWKRVIRALETFLKTGKTIKELQKEYKRELDFEFIQIGLDWNRERLYSRIEERVDLMIDAGLVDEVKCILDLGYNKELNALNTVGYKEIISYLENEISLERAIELIKRNTRRYAKRQLTWFRKDERINWERIDKEEQITEASQKIFNSL